MIFLDFEASGIRGFPIQVGFCVVDQARDMQTAAKLIRHDEWLLDFFRWDCEAEQIHRISRANLRDMGESPRAVMGWLNSALGGMVACADSHRDKLWLRELADAAGIEPTFRVEEMALAFAGPEIARIADATEADAVCQHTHQADDDAKHLAVQYLLSLREGAPVQRLYWVPGSDIERRSLDEPTDETPYSSGLTCSNCGWVYLEPDKDGHPFCGRCEGDLRPTTWGDIRALPVGVTVNQAPTRPY